MDTTRNLEAANYRNGSLPLHIQVSEMLARDIQAGILIDGERLEPERTMASSLGIAVGTLRKALADLHQKGLLERVQGSGNYVRTSDLAKTIYSFFRLELVDGGGLPSAETLSVRRMNKPRSLPSFGQCSQAIRIRRIRRLNEIHAAVEEIWLDGSYAETLTTTELPDSLYQFYRESLGLWIARTEDKVGVEKLPAWALKEFITPQVSYGFVERLSWDQLGVCAEYSRTWFDPADVRYVARWK